MAIVLDLNRSPPGRANNQIGIDQHNLTRDEFSAQNDGLRNDVSLTLPIGGSQILAVDGTRNNVTVVNPLTNADLAIGTRALAAVNGLGAISVFAGTTVTIKGILARSAFYVYTPAAQSLTILVG